VGERERERLYELSTGCSAFEEHSGTQEHTSTEAQVSPSYVLTLEDQNMIWFGFASFNWLMCVCVCVCVCVYVYTHTHVYMYTCIYLSPRERESLLGLGRTPTL
jgi:hypothetical protein